MKINTITILKHKAYLLSVFLLISAGIFSALPAYSQIDYTYGINQRGFRFGVGAGAASLQTYWGEQPIKPAAVLTLDYNVNPYFSLGVEAEYGQLVGIDNKKHYAYLQSTNTYTAGNFNIKIAVGQVSDFNSKNGFTDALKRIYLGVGVGAIYSSVVLTNRSDGLVVPPAEGAMVLATKTQFSNERTGTFMNIPVNFGTNIDLPGVLGLDKLELNPNFEYNFVNSKIFDGYEPNAKVANGAYALVSLSIKYKF